MSDDPELLLIEVDTSEPRSDRTPVAGEMWSNSRNGIPVEVRKVRVDNDIMAVDVQTHGATNRMSYSLTDFLLYHSPPENVKDA